MFDDLNYDLFGNPVYPSLDDCINQLKFDFDLVQVNKRKLSTDLIHSLNNEYYISDVLCHQIFPELSTLEVQHFNDDANSRFS